MKKGKKIIMIIIVFAIFAVAIGIRNNSKFNFYSHKYNVKVIKFDNFYEGNNIKLYYMDGNNDYQKNFKENHELDKIIQNAGNEIDKSTALISWINTMAEFSINGTMEDGKSGEDILKRLQSNKTLSSDGYATILEEALSSVGVYVRKGTLCTSNDEKPKPRQSYRVIEVWSKSNGKWVMIDPATGCYFTKDNNPLSAVELVDTGLSTVEIVNLSGVDKIKYKKEMEKYFNTYTIAIDNNKFTDMESNAYITYVRNEESVQLENQSGYISPMIFVKKKDVFTINPEIERTKIEEDKIPTLIFSKKDKKEDNDNCIKFTVGAFENSVMLDEYYISLDGDKFYKVKNYYDLSITDGQSKIMLSLDGKTPLREVVLQKGGK